MSKYYAPSELIINSDGSVFHLHLKPGQIADKILLVGDPGRVDLVASFFDSKVCEVTNREFKTITGYYQGKPITVLSTGIGCDNIDIVMNELDALANIDFTNRIDKSSFTKLQLLRLGTCGGLQPEVPFGTIVASTSAIGLDGLLNFYARSNEVRNKALENEFIHHMGWQGNMCNPHTYAVDADVELSNKLASNDIVRGITMTAGGFYGPQGREIRLKLADEHQNDKLFTFTFGEQKIVNYEMESSALFGLSKLLGHQAATLCLVLANRAVKSMNTDYKKSMEQLILTALQRI